MNLKKPSLRQWIMILYIPFHLIWFFVLEQAVTTNYHIIYCAWDDLIPFCEWFIFPYFLWFLYMVVSGLYFLIEDEEAFEHYMLSLVFGFFISTVICSIYPNGQDLRPEAYGSNFAAQIVKWTQGFDTNTNVFPSMHVVGALGAAFAIAKSQKLKSIVWLQILNWVLCVTIIMATVFLKQHSVLDIVAGIVVCVFVFWFVYKGYAGKVLTAFETLITKKRRT